MHAGSSSPPSAHEILYPVMHWLYSNLISLVIVFASLLIFITATRSRRITTSNFHAIPTIGPSGRYTSYIGAFWFMLDNSRMIQDGYDKYKNALFKIADFKSWMVVVSGHQLIEDVRKAPEGVLAFEAAIDEAFIKFLVALHSLAPQVKKSHFHVPIIRTQLTQGLGDLFPEILDEIITSFNEVLGPQGIEWINVPALATTLEVVGRTAHRVFVGLPLCRDPDYQVLNIRFALDISKAASIIRFFPPFLKPLVGRLFANVPAALKDSMSHLRPIVEERKKNVGRYGREYPGKPEDLLSWFIDDLHNDDMSLERLSFHILTVNFGAVYTISMSFTQALYHLAAHPEYSQPLREEVEAITLKEGWTNYAMGEMRKLDSFLKESQRLTGLSLISTYRRVLKPFTFSDGTCIPPGVTIAVAANSTHLDEAIYPNAKSFDGFRFVNMRERDGEHDKHQMVTISPDFLAFGIGRHVCPGRFFTVIVLKAMLAHIIMNYDIKFEMEGERPPGSWFIAETLPNMTARVLLRKHQTPA